MTIRLLDLLKHFLHQSPFVPRQIPGPKGVQENSSHVGICSWRPLIFQVEFVGEFRSFAPISFECMAEGQFPIAKVVKLAPLTLCTDRLIKVTNGLENESSQLVLTARSGFFTHGVNISFYFFQTTSKIQHECAFGVRLQQR